MTSRWAQQWVELLDDGTADIARRLQQGRNLVRSGRVTGVQTHRGAVSGSVQGYSATPLLTDVTVPVLTDAQWETVTHALASQVRHRARLLAGQVPDGLDAQLEAHGVSLFPDRAQLDVTCRCSDRSLPCMHAAAVWQAVADEIDRDPFVLLRVRGRGRERLLAESAAARVTAAEQPAPGRALQDLPTAAWFHSPRAIDDFVPAAPPAPRTPAGPLRLLGDPPGWAGGVSAGDLFAGLVVRGAEWAAVLLEEPAGD